MMSRSCHGCRRRGGARPLSWFDGTAAIVSIVVSLAVVGQVALSASRADTVAAGARTADAAVAFSALAAVALGGLGAAAPAPPPDRGEVSLGTWGWAVAGARGGGGGGGAVWYLEPLRDPSAWAARASAEYGAPVAPGASCGGGAGEEQLIVSYCTAGGGGGGGGGGCDTPLFECPDSASPARAAAASALLGAAPTALPSPAGAAGVYTSYTRVGGGVLASTVDVASALAAAVGSGGGAALFDDVAVVVTDVTGGEEGGVLVYARGVAAGAASLVAPVVATRVALGRTVQVRGLDVIWVAVCVCLCLCFCVCVFVCVCVCVCVCARACAQVRRMFVYVRARE
jgi:hypothetical protein